MRDVFQEVRKIYKIINEENNIYYQTWKNQMVFSWRWWLTVALLILPWLIWFKFRKKGSSGRLLLVGFFVYFITTFFDSIGIAFGLWHYNITPMPYIHNFFMPWDFSLFPIIIMLMLQCKPKTSPYSKALIFSVFCSLIAEPFFDWIQIYEAIRWKHYFGLPIYFVIYLLANKLSKIKSFEELQ